MLNGEAEEAILDSYTPERRGATLDVFEKSSKSAQFMTPRTRGFRIMRDAALSLALDHPFAGQFANPRQMTPHEYRHSPLTGEFRETCDGPRPGAFAPDVRLDEEFLLDRCGTGFCVLTFGTVDGLDKLQDASITQVALSPSGRGADVYGARDGDAVLLRPDRFVAARWRNATGSQIGAEIERILKGGG